MRGVRRSGGTPGVRRLALVVVLVAIVSAACSSGATGTPTIGPASPSSASTAPSSSASAPIPASPVVGIVLTIDSSGLTQVHGFTLRTTDGHVFTFTIGQLDNPTQFPPGHLGEHQAGALPVRVFFRSESGSLVVYRLEDASA